MKKIKFIDLFAGLGGMRIGFEQACSENGIISECVFTSEIKSYALDIYKQNFNSEAIYGDICEVKAKDIPDFDYLLAGFPCQAFSVAGKRGGFSDTRGTLFFEIEKILKEKKPKGFILENVEGLVKHDKNSSDDEIGNTLATILKNLKALGYYVDWKVLDAVDFGVPQSRKRIYITGSLSRKPNLSGFKYEKKLFKSIQEKDLDILNTEFTTRLLELYSISELEGKSIKDKRGGPNNIHSWDLELKGELNKVQKDLMSKLLKERRKKIWAIKKGISWMDGMPLTLEEISSFYKEVSPQKLKFFLEDLVRKKYLRFEHPKDIVVLHDGRKIRLADESKEKGYNIVTGKLSFELNKILGENSIAPTIVATEVDRIGVIDNEGVRRLSERECLRLFGFPEWYKSNIDLKGFYDLIGNTVVVPVVKVVCHRVIECHYFKAIKAAS